MFRQIGGGTISKDETVLIDMAWPPNGKFSFQSFLVCFTRNQDERDIQEEKKKLI